MFGILKTSIKMKTLSWLRTACRLLLGWAGAFAIGLALLIGLTACGQRPTALNKAVLVSADQIAKAMQGDRFYSDYGHQTLLVKGTVQSVVKLNADWVALLGTSVPMKVACHFGPESPKVRVGQTIIVQSAEGERGAPDMSLRNCRLRNP